MPQRVTVMSDRQIRDLVALTHRLRREYAMETARSKIAEVIKQMVSTTSANGRGTVLIHEQLDPIEEALAPPPACLREFPGIPKTIPLASLSVIHSGLSLHAIIDGVYLELLPTGQIYRMSNWTCLPRLQREGHLVSRTHVPDLMAVDYLLQCRILGS